MKLHFILGYHPEGDRQTSNQSLKQYLRVYCNYQQDNWDDLLPLAEFSYNNTPSATTRVSLFFANKGYQDTTQISLCTSNMNHLKHQGVDAIGFITEDIRLYRPTLNQEVIIQGSCLHSFFEYIFGTLVDGYIHAVNAMVLTPIFPRSTIKCSSETSSCLLVTKIVASIVGPSQHPT